MPERSPLEVAAEKAVPLLERLGDFIANKEGRCEALLALRDAMRFEAAARSISKPNVSVKPDAMARILFHHLGANEFVALWEILDAGRADEMKVPIARYVASMCPKCGKLVCKHDGSWQLGGGDEPRD